MKISHTNILVKIDGNAELVETPVVGYDKNTYEANRYGACKFDKLQQVPGEHLVSLAQLMTINISSYVTALRDISSELE